MEGKHGAKAEEYGARTCIIQKLRRAPEAHAAGSRHGPQNHVLATVAGREVASSRELRRRGLIQSCAFFC